MESKRPTSQKGQVDSTNTTTSAIANKHDLITNPPTGRGEQRPGTMPAAVVLTVVMVLVVFAALIALAVTNGMKADRPMVEDAQVTNVAPPRQHNLRGSERMESDETGRTSLDARNPMSRSGSVYSGTRGDTTLDETSATEGSVGDATTPPGSGATQTNATQNSSRQLNSHGGNLTSRGNSADSSSTKMENRQGTSNNDRAGNSDETGSNERGANDPVTGGAVN